MAGEIYLSGLAGTDFDYKPILEKYKELKSIPIQMMQENIQKTQLKQKALSTISATLSSLLPSSIDLAQSTTYETKKVSVGDESIISATVSDNALNTSYNIEVLQLARANKYHVGNSTTAITDINTILPTGNLNIDYYKDGALQTLTIDYTNKTLADIVHEINQNENLSASIINVGTSTSPDYELIISAKNTGIDNRISSISDTGSTFDNISETVSAQNAQIRIDGILLENSTNKFENVITGVSITAKDIGTSTIEISDDYSKIKTSIENLLNGYNKLKDIIELSTSKGQPLQGEASLNTIYTGLFRIITSHLGKYGLIDVEGTAENTKGHLLLKEDKFNEFIKREDAKEILQSFGTAVEEYINNYSDNLRLENQRYTQQINEFQERIAYMDERLNKQIENMRLRYAKLETYLSEMQAVQLRIKNFASSFTGQENK